MSKFLDRVRTLADIVKIGSEIYGLLVDKSRATAADKAKIAELEKEIQALKNQLK